MPQPLERIQIAGVPVDVVQPSSALEHIDRMISGAEPKGYVVAINPEKVMACRRDPVLAKFINNASLLIPDGVGVVVAARLVYGVVMQRVTGVDLAHSIMQHSARTGYRIFVLGSTEDTNREAVAWLKEKYDGLNVVDRHNGYFDEDDPIVSAVNESNADILFVALGSPRQENWIKQHLPQLNVKVCMGIGGTLDTVVNKVRRAPRIFQILGLEWLFRLACQPTRAYRQMSLVAFVRLVIAQTVNRSNQSRRLTPFPPTVKDTGDKTVDSESSVNVTTEEVADNISS